MTNWQPPSVKFDDWRQQGAKATAALGKVAGSAIDALRLTADQYAAQASRRLMIDVGLGGPRPAPMVVTTPPRPGAMSRGRTP